MRTVLRQRLFQRFLLSLGGALVLAFGLAAVVTLTVGTRSLRANVKTELDGTANTIHLTLEAFLDARGSDLQLVSQAEAMDDVLTGDANFRIQNALMELLRTTHGTYDELFVVDAQGVIISGTRMERIGESLPFPIASLAPTTDGNWLTAGPMRVPGTGERVLPMARPLRSRLAQQNSGWLVALVRWSRISALVSNVAIAGRPQRPLAFAVLFTGDAPAAGRLEWLPQAMQARSMTRALHRLHDAHDPEGAGTRPQSVAGRAPDPIANWHVLVMRDTHEAFAVVRMFAWSVLAAGIIGLLVAAAVVFRLARDLSGRIDSLTRGTQRLAAGDYAHRVTDSHDDELALLAGAFNNMAGSLTAARARIESSHTELESSNQRLREASRLKDEFLANTSHELRTPLNGILGFLGLVTDGLCDDAEEERLSIRQALQCGQQLHMLIEDILDVSRIEAGRLTVSSNAVPVARVVARVIAEMRPRAEARGLVLGADLPDAGILTVLADEPRLHHVLRLLLDNAIKFTETGAVTVVCWVPEGTDHVRFEVRDTGIGVRPERQREVFERFVQGDGSATRKFGGTGLGLSLVRDLTGMMGGVVQLHSAGVGLGTTVSFTLPIGSANPDAADAGEQATADDDRVHGPASGPLVLLVEDDLTTASWLSSVLNADGFRTVRAGSAERAWMMVRKLWPSVVLLDHALPAAANARLRTGSELARHLAEHRPTANLPVIMLSGHDLVALEGEGALPRQTTVLRKPVTREALLAELWRQEARNKRRTLHVLLAHHDPELLRFVHRTLPTSHFRVSIEPNNHTFLETLAAQPRLFDVVLLEPCSEPGDTPVLLRGFAALETPPPLVVIADLGATGGRDAEVLHEWPVLRVFSKSEVLAEPGALLERLLEIGRPSGRAARDSEAAAA